MTDNIIQMPTPKSVLAERYRKAYERSEHGRDEWIESVLEMAATLAEARDQFNNDRAFSIWLAENDLNMHNEHDRAALINMGQDLTLARIVLQETRRTSLQWIWLEEMKSRFAHVSKPQPMSTQISEPPLTHTPMPESDNPAPGNGEISGRSVKLNVKSALHAIPRGEELAAVFLGEKPRTLIGHVCQGRKGKPILDLILAALDAGLLTPTEMEFRTPTLYLLFPQAPMTYARRFDLTDAKKRAEVAESILPAMIACRDKLLANPQDMPNILNAYVAEQRALERAKEAETKRQAAVAALTPGQNEIVMYGVTLWPRLDNRQGEYDYDQVRAAVWTFRDLDNWNRMITNDNGAGSRGIRIRLSTKWYSEYLIRNGRDNPIRRIITLVHYISRLMESAPEAECKWPPYPTSEAEWN